MFHLDLALALALVLDFDFDFDVVVRPMLNNPILSILPSSFQAKILAQQRQAASDKQQALTEAYEQHQSERSAVEQERSEVEKQLRTEVLELQQTTREERDKATKVRFSYR